MNHKTIKIILASTAIAAASLLFAGCGDDDNPIDPNETGNADAIFITHLDDGVSYIQAINVASASTIGTVTQTDATQVMSDMPFTWSYGSYAYLAPYERAEVTQYSIASDGSLVEEGVLAIPPQAWVAGMAFVSDTKTYMSLYNTGRVVAFNPTTMAEITSIDLTPYAVEGYSVSPASMIVQGDRLIVALHQMQGMMTFDPNAHVVIIDINADTVITHITDARASWAACREAVQSIFVDDDGDVYIACSAMFGMAVEAPEGILRIKSGETEFDPDYFWDVSNTSAEGEPSEAVGLTTGFYAMSYIDGTKGVGIILNAGYMDVGEDIMTGHYMKPVEFDFIAKTMKVLDIPTGDTYGHGLVRHGNKFLFSLDIIDGNGVYEYNPVTSQSKLLFTSDASPCGIVEIQ